MLKICLNLWNLGRGCTSAICIRLFLAQFDQYFKWFETHHQTLQNIIFIIFINKYKASLRRGQSRQLPGAPKSICAMFKNIFYFFILFSHFFQIQQIGCFLDIKVLNYRVRWSGVGGRPNVYLAWGAKLLTGPE